MAVSADPSTVSFCTNRVAQLKSRSNSPYELSEHYRGNITRVGEVVRFWPSFLARGV
jgi:hypothetical protein